MKQPIARVFVLACALAMGACAPEPATQVFVRIDVEDRVEAQIDQLEVIVWGGSEGGVLEAGETLEIDAVDYPWPATLGVVPAAGDASRVVEVEIRALDRSDAVLATARGTTGFVASETRLLDLLLYDACIGTSCGDSETCFEGACVDSFIEPAELPSYTCPLVCGELCVQDPMEDDTHCGTCGNTCADVETCVMGSCQELSCEAICGDDCVVEFDSDNEHCGRCDNACAATATCVSGQCE